MPILVAHSVSAHHCFDHKVANVSECLDTGACLELNGANCPNQSTAGDKVNDIVRVVVNIFSVVVGVASVVMIILGGLKYVTSGGESSNLSSAKNTILYAIVGLIVVALSQIIVRFVLKNVVPELPKCPPGQTVLADGKPCNP